MLPLTYSHSSDSCRQFVQRGVGGMINLLRYLDSIVDCTKEISVLRRCMQYIYNILSGFYIPLILT